MTQWLSLSRAARLVGVARGVLQKEIREGRLATSDGLVSTASLGALYPDFSLEESGAFERVARLKEEAFGRRVLEHVLPSQAVMARRLFAQSQELADVRRHLQRYHELVVATQRGIDELATTIADPGLARLSAALERGLADVLATETPDALSIMDDMLKIVSAHVTLRPSGNEFFVEGRDSLLQAGLKAGLKLNYGCGNGTCGLCKARVVSGEVVRTMPFDYPMSEAERLQGYTLLCAHSAGSSEIAIETLEALGPGEIPEQEIGVRVRAITALAPDTRLLHLTTLRTGRLRFLAGQSVTLFGGPGGRDAQGVYPVASCPCDDRNLHFHVGRNADDAFSEMVFEGALKPGDPLTVWGPVGDFVLAEGGRPLAFVACDTGFAPIKSLLEHAMAIDAVDALSLDWLATRPDGHYLANQCRAWAAAFDHFRYAAHADPDPAGGARRVADAMAAALPLAASDVYVAGPAPFVAAITAALREAGVPAEHLRALAL
jgi:CDP-4-dehydro-6-deoxyglucose reductase